MAKGIIVADMPENCGDCACCQYDGQYDRYCGVNGEDLMNIDWNSEKPNWCPLKLIPEKKEVKNAENMTSLGWIEGWNSCLYEIEGRN